MNWNFGDCDRYNCGKSNLEHLVTEYIRYHNLDKYEYELAFKYSPREKCTRFSTDYRYYFRVLPFHQHINHFSNQTIRNSDGIYSVGMYIKDVKLYVPLFECHHANGQFIFSDLFEQPFEGRRKVYQIDYYPLKVENIPRKVKLVTQYCGCVDNRFKTYCEGLKKIINVRTLINKI